MFSSLELAMHVTVGRIHHVMSNSCSGSRGNPQITLGTSGFEREEYWEGQHKVCSAGRLLSFRPPFHTPLLGWLGALWRDYKGFGYYKGLGERWG
jgi:hypothetical protein